jgi:hypothetical protein
MENSHENASVGNLILDNGIGNYTFDLIDNAKGLFKLNGTNLLVKLRDKILFLRKSFLYRQLKVMFHIVI